MKNGEPNEVTCFAGFELDTAHRRLLREGKPIALNAKAFDLLAFLVENVGRIVTKDEILDAVWQGQFVEEANLTVQMSALRKALGEQKDTPRFLVTIPGKGYKFVADVKNRSDEVIIEKHKFERVVVNEEIEDTTKTQVEQLTDGNSQNRKAIFAFAGLALLMLLGFAGYRYFTAAPQTNIKSIAVLPFKPLVAENRDESLEMGMADTLITKLSNIREINIRPISAVRKYAEVEQDAVAAGREQKVDAVLDGQIQKSGEKIRITIRLVRVADGMQIWSSQFDEKMTDIFTVQDSISERVAGVLALKLSGEERVLVSENYTNNADAYQLYLKGRYFRSKRTGEAIKKSIDYFNQAIENDPNYALAFAGLADSYQLLSNYNVTTPAEAYSKARGAVTEALKRNDKLSEAHASLANIKSGYDWDFAGAEIEFKRAIELNPNLAGIHGSYGEYLAQMGRLTEALAEIRRAKELEPLSLVINTDLGSVLYFTGQFDESIEQLRKTLELDPNFGRAHIELGFAYRQKRQYKDAVSEFKKALDIDKEDSYALSQLAHTYAVLGQREDAFQIIEQMKELAKRNYVLPSDIAAVYAGLGEKDRAFEWLEKAYTDRDDGIPFLKIDPSWDNLRSDSRFSNLLRRIGLPE